MARHFMKLALDLQDEDPITGETQAQQAERSPEEDAQNASEATTELSEAVAASDDVDRFSDVADALEDAAVILDSIAPENVGPEHQALKTTLANMAIAGQSEMDATDVTGDTPGLSVESYVGRRLSTEGFKDAAKRIWETIKRWVKKIWAKIEGFFHKHFGRIPRMRKSLEQAEKQLQGAESKPREDKKIDLTSGLSQMVVANVKVNDFKIYGAALAALTDVVSDVFKGAAKTMSEGGDKLADAIGDFDVSASALSMVKVKDAANFCIPNKGSLKSIGGSRPTFLGGGTGPTDLDASYSVALPGNIAMRMSKLNAKSARSNESSFLAGELLAIRSSGITAVYPEKAMDIPSSLSIDTPAIDQVRAAIGQCTRILDSLESFYRGKAFKDLKDAQDKITKGGDKISAAVSKVKAEDLKDQDLSHFRQITGMASSFVQQALRAYGGISTTAMTSCSFVCTVASKTASAYRNK